MNKAVLLVLALAVATVFGQDVITCQSSISCSAVGGQCGFINSTSVTGAYNLYDCGYGLYCNTGAPLNGFQGTCATLLAAGATCDPFSDNCGNNLFCNSTAKVCQTQTFTAAAGATCDLQGVNCAAGLSCQLNATGFNLICQTRPALGAACTSECAGGASCIAKVCVQWGTVAVGSTCTQTEDCTPGNVCSALKCTAVSASSNAVCSTSSTSPNACASATEYCTCSNFGGSPAEKCVARPTFSSGDISTIASFFTCEETKCGDGDTNCIINSCKSQGCSASSIESRGSQGKDCGSLCGSGSALAASIVFVVVAAFFAL